MSGLRQCWTSMLILTLAGGLGLASVEARAQAAPPKPVRVRAKLEGFDIEPKSGKAPNQIGGASRGIGGFVLYAPKMAKSYTLTPTFAWSSDDPAEQFLFQLSVLSAGRGQIYETKVTGGQMTYPADAPALEPGATYVWRVTPVNDMLGGPASATVLIVGGEERAAIAAGIKGKPVADAKFFVEKRLWYDSVAAYTSLIQSDPAHTDFYKSRADLYDQLPQTQALADADMVKAQH